jgi:hypothetical protein
MPSELTQLVHNFAKHGAHTLGRLFAVFNVLAGGASIAGLYITAFTDYNSWILAVVFLATAVFVGYVLFIPGNRITANVTAKLQKYQSPDGLGTVTMLRDEFVVAGYSWKEIPFPHPFKEPPQVELVKLSGSSYVAHSVAEVTVHKFVVVAHPETQSTGDAQYRWIAMGTLLSPVKDKKAA